MERLEVSGAVRHIYIYMSLGVKGLKVTSMLYCTFRRVGCLQLQAVNMVAEL
jgi:hypothetical protein